MILAITQIYIVIYLLIYTIFKFKQLLIFKFKQLKKLNNNMFCFFFHIRTCYAELRLSIFVFIRIARVLFDIIFREEC